MIRGVFLIVIASAATALADVPLLTLTLAGETVTVAQGSPIAAEITLNANGQPAVYLKLSPVEASRFAKMTDRHVGQIVTISLCSERLTEALLQTPIPNGALVISGDPASQSADQIAARLTAGRCDVIPAD